jgi:hypothetical protein
VSGDSLPSVLQLVVPVRDAARDVVDEFLETIRGVDVVVDVGVGTMPLNVLLPIVPLFVLMLDAVLVLVEVALLLELEEIPCTVSVRQVWLSG